MDCIHLTEFAPGYTGYLPEEQVLGQWFEVDVTLWLDLSRGRAMQLKIPSMQHHQQCSSW